MNIYYNKLQKKNFQNSFIWKKKFGEKRHATYMQVNQGDFLLLMVRNPNGYKWDIMNQHDYFKKRWPLERGL
jgi:hypothetical protein